MELGYPDTGASWQGALDFLSRPSADVVVVGGGFAGLSAAWRLASGGADVLLLEGREHPGAGASGRMPAVAVRGVAEHPWRLVHSLGAPDARDLHALGARGFEALDGLGALRRTGSIWTSVEQEREPEELARSSGILAGWGVPASLLPPAAVDEALGTTGFGPGLRVDDEGHARPDALGRLARAARAAGARLVAGCPTLALDEDGDRRIVRTPRGDVAADVVVVAAEAGTAALVPAAGTWLQPVRHATLALSGPAPPDRPALRAAFGWTWGAPTDDGWHLCGCRWASPHLELGETDEAQVHPAVLERLVATAARFLPHHVPTRAWGAIAARGCDGLPVVGPLPGSPDVVLCAGFDGQGVGLGIGCGLGVADALLGDDPLPPRLRAHRLVT